MQEIPVGDGKAIIVMETWQVDKFVSDVGRIADSLAQMATKDAPDNSGAIWSVQQELRVIAEGIQDANLKQMIIDRINNL